MARAAGLLPFAGAGRVDMVVTGTERRPLSSPATPLSIVKIRFGLPGRLVVAGFRGGLENAVSTEDRGSNPSPSSGESGANQHPLRLVPINGHWGDT
jgi:hypothetical protein